MDCSPPRRVLFFAEAATLAHVGRPLVLARELAGAGWRVVFARPASYAWMTADDDFETLDLLCQPAAEFARRLDAGRPLYDLDTLQRYVADDLALIERIQPDLVIGDFRLSLSVSARLAGIPYATLCDAYWSPEAPLDPVLPVLPFTRFMPIGLAQRVFRIAAPVAFRLHARPMEALRRAHGLPGFDHNLRRCYTDADLRLFANPRALFPDVRTHAGADFIGPVAWSPDASLPDDFPDDDGLIYVSMGSSGSIDALAAVFDALSDAVHPVVVTTAGRPAPPTPAGSRIRLYDFLPGRDAIARARLVICNGGSPTTNQALAAGVPVIGIPTNMDQFLNMRAIEAYGAGRSVRADRVDAQKLRPAIDALIDQADYRLRAATLAEASPPEHILATILDRLHGAIRRPPG